jgi:hypothetical protein
MRKTVSVAIFSVIRIVEVYVRDSVVRLQIRKRWRDAAQVFPAVKQ